MSDRLRLVDGPYYRMWDRRRSRWVVGRDACIDAPMRQAFKIGYGEDDTIDYVRERWPRSVFR